MGLRFCMLYHALLLLCSASNTWTPASNGPGSASLCELAFATTLAVPDGGYIIVELPSSGWSMPPVPQVQFSSPLGASASAVWDDTNDRLTLTATSEIVASSSVSITLSDVKTPSGAVQTQTATLVTRDTAAAVIDGPFDINVVEIASGQLSGGLRLSPAVSVRDTFTDVSVFFTNQWEVPAGGFVTVELPTGWSCASDAPLVTFTQEGIDVLGNWSESRSTLTVVCVTPQSLCIL